VERHVSRVTRDLERTERRPLPDDAGMAFAVAADGSLVFTPTGIESDGRVVATSSLGEFLWRSEPLAGYADNAAIDHQGRVIVSASRYETAELVALDGATGALLWRFDAEGYSGPPAVAPDGSIRFPLGSPKLTSQELIALEADGSLRFRTPLPGNPVSVGMPTCVDTFGRSFVRTFDALVAVDETGAVLFSKDVHPNGVYTCAIDESGDAFYASLGFAAFDPASGNTLWSLADGFAGPAPNTLYYSGPVVIAGDRRLILMDHGGGVHILGD
jgi:outer membrane protein assembly factor BamB